jgi:hypothetical protein
MTVRVSIFMKPKYAGLLFVKNSHTELHVNLTNNLITDITRSQTDGQTWSPHQALLYFVTCTWEAFNPTAKLKKSPYNGLERWSGTVNTQLFGSRRQKFTPRHKPEFVQRNLGKHEGTRINFKPGEFYIRGTALSAHRPAHHVHADDDDHDKYDDDHAHVVSYLTAWMRLNGLKTSVAKNHLKCLYRQVLWISMWCNLRKVHKNLRTEPIQDSEQL